MPRRLSKRAIASSSVSQSPSPRKKSSPRKKPSPIKKLVLRRMSQTPEKSVYQIVARNPPKTFLEESYDETTPSPPPPPLHIEPKEDVELQKNTVQNKLKNANRRISFNSFGLEESADDESESEEEIKLQKSKKKKKTSKKLIKTSMMDSPDIFADSNMSIVLEGVKIIQDVTALLNQDVTLLRSTAAHGKEQEEEVEKVPDSPLPTLQKLSLLASPDIEMENIASHSTISFIKQTPISTISFTKNEEPLSKISIPEQQPSTTILKSNKFLEDDKENIPTTSNLSPFTFTPELLERLKSQQLPPHVSIPKGDVAVKLVPQNRLCAPAFIQISQKDFRRMFPKLPQQQQQKL